MLQEAFGPTDVQHVISAQQLQAEGQADCDGRDHDEACSTHSDSTSNSETCTEKEAHADAVMLHAFGKRLRSDTFRDAHIWYLRCITDSTSFSSLGIQPVKDDPLQDCGICAQLPEGELLHGFCICIHTSSNMITSSYV